MSYATYFNSSVIMQQKWSNIGYIGAPKNTQILLNMDFDLWAKLQQLTVLKI